MTVLQLLWRKNVKLLFSFLALIAYIWKSVSLRMSRKLIERKDRHILNQLVLYKRNKFFKIFKAEILDSLLTYWPAKPLLLRAHLYQFLASLKSRQWFNGVSRYLLVKLFNQSDLFYNASGKYSSKCHVHLMSVPSSFSFKIDLGWHKSPWIEWCFPSHR